MTLQSELKISKEELKVIQKIAQSHPYFPELALDDFTFNNKKGMTTMDIRNSLYNKHLCYYQGESIYLVKAFAKEYWNDIVSSIAIPEMVTVNRAFLETRDFKDLKEAYHILTSKNPIGLSKSKIINEILTFYQEKKDMVKQGEKKEATSKEAKKPVVKKEGMTPKEAATKAGITPSALRRILRKLYGKTEGAWAISEKQLEEAMEAYKKDQADSAKLRAERLEKARAAKANSKKEAKPTKASK